MFGVDLTKGILFLAAPIAASAALGNIIESKSDSQCGQLIGKTVQMIPTDGASQLFLEEKIRPFFSDFWAPKVTICITLSLLFIPLIIKELRVLLEKKGLDTEVAILDWVDKAVMVAVKVMNTVFLIWGLGLAILTANPLLIGLYSTFLIAQLYPYIAKIVSACKSQELASVRAS